MIKSLYDRLVRDRLPKRVVSANGVAIVGIPWLDTPHEIDHETALCDAIDEHVNPEDTVVLIGTGKGVSTVHASIAAGKDGQVIGYEAVKEYADMSTETVSLNVTPSAITIRHSQVGDVSDFSESQYGSSSGSAINPSSIPDCDVLVTDCEGSELDILQSMHITPETCIIESHGFIGSTTSDVIDCLNSLGYSTAVVGVEDRDKDIRIVIGE